MTDKVRTREVLEQFSNAVSRRGFLEKSIRTLFAVTAATVVGNLSVQQALAAGQYCCAPVGVTCNGCPDPVYGNGGCPQNFNVCTTSTCSSYCNYATGSWNCRVNGNGNLIACKDCMKSGATCTSNGNASTGPCTCAKASPYFK